MSPSATPTGRRNLIISKPFITASILPNSIFRPDPDDYLLFFGRMHPDKGAREAVEIAKAGGKKLILAGIVQDQDYFDHHVAPHLNNDRVTYIGSVGPVERNRLLGKACAMLHPIQPLRSRSVCRSSNPWPAARP
jgi:glycosyltransferase involved in cell wall biosynthesis